MYLMILELAIGIIVVAFLITQVLIPIWNGLPLFPFFRQEAKVDAKQSEAEEQVRIFQKEKKVDRTLDRAGIRRASPDDDTQD